jgi:protein LTV1
VPVNKQKETHSKSSDDVNLPPEKRRKEQQNYGVFFDDDYNYLQHLRDPGRNQVYWQEIPQRHTTQEEKKKPKIQLPSSVFESNYEEEEGLLNKAAPRTGPQLDWDPDIVAAMDEDFNFEDPDNELEDNFMELATGINDEDGEWEDEQDYDSDGLLSDIDEENDAVGPLRHFSKFDDEETRSRFTEYSMSSSVIRRNEQLSLLDDRFEKFYENYDEPEVGPLDCEEIEGNLQIDDNLLENLQNDFQKNEVGVYKKEWDIIRMVKMQHREEEKPEEFVELDVTEAEGEIKKFDCESILSTYSNIYNHPKLIEVPSKRKTNVIKVNPRTGIPIIEQPGKLTEKSLAKLNNEATKATGAKSLCAESVISTLSVLSIRPKDETPEEKRERKKLLKEYRNERRIEKKANKMAFNDERMRQHQIDMNNRRNLQGNKII